MKEILIQVLPYKDYMDKREQLFKDHVMPANIYIDGVKVQNLTRFSIDITEETPVDHIHYLAEYDAPYPEEYYDPNYTSE